MIDLNVLCIDDSDGLLISELLSAQGASVVLVRSSAAAQARLAAHGFDVVIADYGLSDTDSLAFIRWLRGAFPAMPLILLASYGAYGIAAEAIHAGATDFIAKHPGNHHLDVLPQAIRKAVAQSKAASEATRMQEQLLAQRAEAEFALRTLSAAGNKNWNGDQIFRVLCDEAPIGIFLTDSAGTCVYANESWHEITGLTLTQVLGHAWTKAVHPLDIDTVLASWQETTRSGNKFAEAIRFTHPTGEVRHACARANAVRDKAGVIFGFVGTVEDVTEHILLETSLREAQRGLRTILDNAPGMIAHYDADLMLRYANPAYLAWFAVTMDTQRSQHISEVIGSDQFEANQTIFLEVLAGTPINVRRSVPNAYGQLRQVVISFIPDRRADAICGFFVFLADITDNYKTEQSLRAREHQLQTVLDNMPALISYWDSDLYNRLANRTYIPVYGKSPESIAGLHMSEIVGEEIYRLNLPYVQGALSGKPQQFERNNVVANGQERVGMVTYIPDFEGDKVKGFFSLVYDVTDRKRTEEALFEERDLARVTLNSICDGVVTTDIDGHILTLNLTAESMSGWQQADAVGKPIETIARLRETDSNEALCNPLRLALRDGTTVRASNSCILQTPNGDSRTIEASAAPIHDRHGQVRGAVLVLHDISESRELASKMAYIAEHDALTGLPNRVLLHDRLHQEIRSATRDDTRFAILFLDLDHFKDINDTLGHSVGDELLLKIAERLKHTLRSSDTISRQGGDEFVVLAPGITSPEEVASVADKILSVVAEPYQIGGAQLSTSFSIGISIYPEDGDDAATLMRHADGAMYHAKRAGRNRYRFSSPEDDRLVMERHALEQQLRDAIRLGQFLLHYQPKIDCRTGGLIGMEALVRWQQADGKLVSPAKFIPLAEDCGLIVPIGAFVLAEACRQTAAWQKMGLPIIVMSVNIAAAQFADKCFAEQLARVLAETGLPPECLDLEITETTLMADATLTAETFKRIKALGVKISVDDFGTGYSSLSYLKRFPVDVIKIDQSFVRDMNTDTDDSAIVRAIISMGRSLRLQVIAEGVETLQQADLLRELECDAMQGYFFSRPVPASAAEEFLRNSTLAATANTLQP